MDLYSVYKSESKVKFIEKGIIMKYILLFVVSIVLLSACVPTSVEAQSERATTRPTPNAQTITAQTATRVANQTMWANERATQAAKPTLSQLDRCIQSGVAVRYVIMGIGVSGVSITLENDSNGTDQGDYAVPFCDPYNNFYSGDFVYISAQIIEPSDTHGSITCRIYYGDEIIAQASANGFASIATCSDSLP